MNFIIPNISAVPFKNHMNDWFAAIIPHLHEIVFVHHQLIIATLKNRGEKVDESPQFLPNGEPGWIHNFNETYHDCGVAFGTTVARWIHSSSPKRNHGDAYELQVQVSGTPLFICGFFGATPQNIQTFLFLPRLKETT